ncbi:single-stranded DNA-binding protein [Streptomyces benahoarensis]|uniref:Single-stranded DNA-binding protein n=1 Tax=Streptomyces benahoarensis TaxID=2595054 RepID=A0A553XG65_9ACTN|nr:single-stranded DNA-binding protein [Streptomyces benahoarensis]TSB14297.1 single-stranded DNA-binding protein [Streptomyces benahoarensis]TSB15887.1 single-stranded DNA-binding protein [Streptomyces benahoarensis]
MNDTMVTLVGNAATAVEHRQTATGVPVARFRLAATPRRWDRARERWTDGDTSFFTVKAWRALADHVAASVTVGEPLMVQGRLRVREGEQPADRGGQRWLAAEVEAVAIGHDLTRGTAAFRRASPRARIEPQAGEDGGKSGELSPDWSTGGGAWRKASPPSPVPDAGGGGSGGAAEVAAGVADEAAARAAEGAAEREAPEGVAVG